MERIDKSSLEPCPFCGSRNLSFSYKTSHGHGDCGYEHARIVCLDCDATKGLYNHGSPGVDDELKAAEAWNTRDGNKTEVKIKKEAENIGYSKNGVMDALYEKYNKTYSIIDFFNLINPQNK